MAQDENNAPEPSTGAQPSGKRKSSYGAKGKSWSWSRRQNDALVRSDEHLAWRYLIDTSGQSAEKFAEICNCSVADVRQMLYGRTKRSVCHQRLSLAAVYLDSSLEEIFEAAKLWHKGDNPEDVIVRVHSLSGSSGSYGFSKVWLQENGLDADTAFIVKQENDFLVSAGVHNGDVFLVNKGDVTFNAGSFYAVRIAGCVWIGMACLQQGQARLAIDPSGIRFSMEDWDALAAAGNILGRCVWRSSML